VASVTVADEGRAFSLRRSPISSIAGKAEPSRRTGTSGLGLAIAAEQAALLGARDGCGATGGGLAFTLQTA
jgi:hypothetical protein